MELHLNRDIRGISCSWEAQTLYIAVGVCCNFCRPGWHCPYQELPTVRKPNRGYAIRRPTNAYNHYIASYDAPLASWPVS